MKFIDADKLIDEIKFAKSVYSNPQRVVHGIADAFRQDGRVAMCDDILKKIDFLQQDKETLELCSKIWWEEQGWIMIPPDATVEGIDSLLRQVKKKLQQEQPDLTGIEESGIPGKDYIPVEWVDACEKYGKWKIVKQEQSSNGDDGKFVKILVRKEFAEQLQKLGDEIQTGQSSFVVAMKEQEQPDEQPEYGYITTKYIAGKKPRWKVGDILSYYINTSNEEGEGVLGKVVSIERDEDGEWLYTFENEEVWDEETLIREGTYKTYGK